MASSYEKGKEGYDQGALTTKAMIALIICRLLRFRDRHPQSSRRLDHCSREGQGSPGTVVQKRYLYL